MALIRPSRWRGHDRLPDVSFISVDRLPAEGELLTAWAIVPDLAVEVVSPNDIYQKLMNKVFEYLDAGVKEVWLVAPESRTVTIYYSFTEVKILTERDELTCEKLLPGFVVQSAIYSSCPSDRGRLNRGKSSACCLKIYVHSLYYKKPNETIHPHCRPYASCFTNCICLASPAC